MGYPDYIRVLIEAGADVDLANGLGKPPLHCVFYRGVTVDESVLLLVKGGAAVNATDWSGSTPLDLAIEKRRRHLFPVLLRAGANLPTQSSDAYLHLQTVILAGDIRHYGYDHLNAITATFIPKFPLLPSEMVRRVVEYAFHVGDY